MFSPRRSVCIVLLFLLVIFYGGVGAQYILAGPNAPTYQLVPQAYVLQASQPADSYQVLPKLSPQYVYVPALAIKQPVPAHSSVGKGYSKSGDAVETMSGDISGEGYQTMDSGRILGFGKKLFGKIVKVGSGLLGGGRILGGGGTGERNDKDATEVGEGDEIILDEERNVMLSENAGSGDRRRKPQGSRLLGGLFG